MLIQKNQTLEIRGMEFMASHGVFDFEKKKLNKFIVNVTIEADFTSSMISDKLSDTLDYSIIYNLVEAEMSQTADLIEHLAFRIGKSIEAISFPIKSILIEVIKTSPPLEGIVQDTRFSVKFE